MEWSDSQGLKPHEGGAASTVGGYKEPHVNDLPEWLRRARAKALGKELPSDIETEGHSS